jgi:hypothetical protein
MIAARVSPQYHLIFDVAASGCTTWHLALAPGGVAAVVATIAVLRCRFVAGLDAIPKGRSCYLLAAIAIFTATTAATILYLGRQEYGRFSSALARGSARTVAGPVFAFIPEGPGGHPDESFRVDGSAYRYSTYDMTSAFHRTAREGGPIRDGMLVRIADVDGKIVRLEVAR